MSEKMRAKIWDKLQETNAMCMGFTSLNTKIAGYDMTGYELVQLAFEGRL